MPNFFSGVLKTGFYTTQALVYGPAKTIEEMHSAQENRFHAFTEMMTSLSYKPHQVVARKQYWCGQTFFLAQLIKNHINDFEEITNSLISVEDEAGLLDAINKLLVALDDKDTLQIFLTLLAKDSKQAAKTKLLPAEASSPNLQLEVQFFCGDAIQLIKDLSNQGTMVVVDNAPNSHRDGAAKYSAGSVEELFSRYTDEALKMVLHFADVHQRNEDKGHYAFNGRAVPVDVGDYQTRYLQMILTISVKLIEKKEAYLETEEFFNDLFTSFPNTEPNHLPIYFGMQNNAYEVPVDGGFTSSHWFANTKNLTTVEGIFQLLATENNVTPLTVTSYAAPDLRKLETTPLDVRATSNKTLQHPGMEGTLANMLSAGIAYQCQQAIKLAQQYEGTGLHQPVAVVFLMPGCGAFNNPQKATAAHFISTIKYYYPQLAKHNISCHVVEHSPELFNVLENTSRLHGPELGELNSVIHQLKDAEIRKAAISVREKIVALYERGEDPGILAHHTALTTQLLKSPPGQERDDMVHQYHLNAIKMTTCTDLLWQALSTSMIILGAALLAVGISLATSGVGLMPSIMVVAGGATILAAGIGFFVSHQVLAEKTTELVDTIGNNYQLD